tara:strand:+ start:685 stop:1431 length:747 start_codon:yes stop_codon:yes gene_type:complete
MIGKRVHIEPCGGGAGLTVGYFNITINGASPIVGQTIDPNQYGPNFFNNVVPTGGPNWGNIDKVEVKSVSSNPGANQTIDFDSVGPCSLTPMHWDPNKISVFDVPQGGEKFGNNKFDTDFHMQDAPKKMKKFELRNIIREAIKEILQEEVSFPVKRKCVRDPFYHPSELVSYSIPGWSCSQYTCGPNSTGCPTGCKCAGEVATKKVSFPVDCRPCKNDPNYVGSVEVNCAQKKCGKNCGSCPPGCKCS